ncbi:hypothetical protein PMAYCL1PPCAC_27174, partial [Pristionchus mayeri]
SNQNMQSSNSSELLPEQKQLEKADHSTHEVHPTEFLDTQSINESHPTGETLAPSLSSPIPSNGDSGETDSQASAHLRVDTYEPRDLNAIEIGNPSDHTETPSLSMVESLGSAALNEECTGLNNPSKVSENDEVKEFTQKENNRPDLYLVTLKKTKDGLKVEILFPENRPFPDFSNLDERRYKQSMKCNSPTLEVKLNGPEDPILEQLSVLLTSSIKYVMIGSYGSSISSSNLPLCAKMLNSSIFSQLHFFGPIFD